MSFKTQKPELTYLISDFIAANGDTSEITYYNFSILESRIVNDDTVHFTESNIVDDYIEELKDSSVVVSLTEENKNKYYYNPDLLSYDLYGTTNLDFIIMKLNGIIDAKDFDIPELKLVYSSTLSDLISDIYNAESSYIKQNRENEGITTG